jgi:xylitol oxidase
LDALERLVSQYETIRISGTRHSFSEIADTNGTQVFTSLLTGIIDVGEESVTVEAGAYGQVGEHLFTRGYALTNYASLPHISIGGAISTPTHGSGSGNSVLADDVISYDLLLADGSSITLSRQHPLYHTALLSLATWASSHASP